MGFFDRLAARGAYDQVYGAGRPHHEVTPELLAGAVGFPPDADSPRRWR